MASLRKNPIFILLICTFTFIFAYYFCGLLHEWLGHGTAAWILGQKNSPFDIYYGGWGLLHMDENVDYDKLIAANQGVTAAIIAISGLTVTAILFIISLVLLARPSIQKHNIIFTFLYWVVTINMVALLQYLTLTTFSSEGDVGRFTHGLNISPFWIFIPGTLLVIAALWRIFKVEIPKAYAIIPISSLWGRRLFLFITLFVIFALIYTHGYNPITDPGTNLLSKISAILSLLLIPILFFLCDPSREWVKKSVTTHFLNA